MIDPLAVAVAVEKVKPAAVEKTKEVIRVAAASKSRKPRLAAKPEKPKVVIPVAAASKSRKPPRAAKPEQAPARPAASPKAFRIGEVWQDTQGRQHRVSPCPTEGLVTLTPIKDDKLEPVAMAIDQPYPWQKVGA